MDTTTQNTLDEELRDTQVKITQDEQAETSIDRQTEAIHPKKNAIDRRRRLVVIGVILTALGWLTLMVNEWLSVALTAAGLIISCLGVRIPPGPRRNLAITAIIAAASLLLVIIALELAIALFT